MTEINETLLRSIIESVLKEVKAESNGHVDSSCRCYNYGIRQ